MVNAVVKRKECFESTIDTQKGNLHTSKPSSTQEKAAHVTPEVFTKMAIQGKGKPVPLSEVFEGQSDKVEKPSNKRKISCMSPVQSPQASPHSSPRSSPTRVFSKALKVETRNLEQRAMAQLEGLASQLENGEVPVSTPTPLKEKQNRASSKKIKPKALRFSRESTPVCEVFSTAVKVHTSSPERRAEERMEKLLAESTEALPEEFVSGDTKSFMKTRLKDMPIWEMTHSVSPSKETKEAIFCEISCKVNLGCEKLEQMSFVRLPIEPNNRAFLRTPVFMSFIDDLKFLQKKYGKFRSDENQLRFGVSFEPLLRGLKHKLYKEGRSYREAQLEAIEKAPELEGKLQNIGVLAAFREGLEQRGVFPYHQEYQDCLLGEVELHIAIVKEHLQRFDAGDSREVCARECWCELRELLNLQKLYNIQREPSMKEQEVFRFLLKMDGRLFPQPLLT